MEIDVVVEGGRGGVVSVGECLYHSPERDSKLGPKHLSLLEFETWQLRPLGYHGWYGNLSYSWTKISHLLKLLKYFF